MDYKHFLYEEYPSYLDQITENLPPKWGIMTSHHLIEHFSLLFAISNGKLDVPSFDPPEKQAKLYTGFFEGKKPFIKYPSSKKSKLASLKFANIDEAKTKLISSFERFKTHFEENPEATCNHPVFGILDHEKWVEFHARHILYHLVQFGLIEDKGIYG